jgi:hypothetical protein
VVQNEKKTAAAKRHKRRKKTHKKLFLSVKICAKSVAKKTGGGFLRNSLVDKED